MPHHRLARRCLAALPLTLAVLAVPAGAAHASTLSYEGPGKLVYTDGGGGSLIRLYPGNAGEVRLEPDSADPLGPLPGGCVQPDEYDPTVTCAASQVRAVMNGGDDQVRVGTAINIPLIADGGAGNDFLDGVYDASDPETFIGGAGNDTLRSWAGNDHLDGGDGNDAVDGGSGTDTVLGGNGTDKVRGDDDYATDADRIDGGAGYDTLSYEWSDTNREGMGGVLVTLGGGNDDGFSGEGDNVTGIEKLETHTSGKYVGTDANEEFYGGGDDTAIEAGGGNDTIYSSYGKDAINGGAGDDTIRGYNGDDVIVGGPGADTLVGDTVGQTCMYMSCSTYLGNDIIDARDGERDSVDCGLGTDTAMVDAVDVHTGCETVQVAGAPAQPQQPGGQPQPNGTAGKPGATLTIARTSLGKALRSGLKISLKGAKPGKRSVLARAGKTLVAKCTVKVSKKGTGKCVLRFTKAGKRKLRSAKRVTLKLSAAGVSKTLTLKR